VRLAVARHVHCRRDLWIRSSEIEMHRPVAKRYSQCKPDRQVRDCIIVKKIRKAIGAFRNLAQNPLCLFRRIVKEILLASQEASDTVLRDEGFDPPVAGSECRQHRTDIAHIGVGRARIGSEEQSDVLVHLPRSDQLDGRNLQAFLEDLPIYGRDAARYAAADIGAMYERPAIGDDLALMKIGRNKV
jgi:hypothetical protein